MLLPRILVPTLVMVFMVAAAAAHEPARGSRHGHPLHRVKLVLEFEPQRDQDGKPLLIDGKPAVSYIPAWARVDKNDNIEVRANVLIRSVPPTPHRFFGRLLSLRDDVQIITSDRIVTNARGVFRATLRSRILEGGWDIKIQHARYRSAAHPGEGAVSTGHFDRLKTFSSRPRACRGVPARPLSSRSTRAADYTSVSNTVRHM